MVHPGGTATFLLRAAGEAPRWPSRDPAPPGSRIKMVRHTSVGEIRPASTSMRVSGVPETRAGGGAESSDPASL
ncbi:hypothetical protein [Streptomyces javensis]|uniref:hypothetical protein n=1 Tax=Streptomyces javensis TaxID=114698 RepID=UPI0031CF42AF